MREPGPLLKVLALERAADVAAAAPAYARALRSLAAALAGRRADTLDEVSAWLLAGLGLAAAGDPAHEDPDWREASWDAAVDLLGDPAGLAGFLCLVAGRLEAGLAPRHLNLLSLLRAKVGWRARDRMRRRAARHARQIAEDTSGEAARSVQAQYVAALVVGRLAEQFGDDPDLQPVLARLLAGETVSEVAEATGLSRQAIYRRLERVRRWVEQPGSAGKADGARP